MGKDAKGTGPMAQKKQSKSQTGSGGGYPVEHAGKVYSSRMRSWLRTNVEAAGRALSPTEVP